MTQPAHLIGHSRKGKPGRIYTISDDYDPLGTCPTPLKSLYRSAAESARNGRPKAILRLKCLECCGWEKEEVEQCQIKQCALWYFRGREEVT